MNYDEKSILRKHAKMKKFIDNVAMKNYNNFTAINYKRRRKL